MTDRDDARPTRRSVLALAGSAMVAGCSATDGVFERGPPTVETAALRDVADADAPSIPETVPVDVEQAALDERRRRTRELLATVPTPLGPSDLPNGAMREALTGRYEHAEERLARAARAPSRFEALGSLRTARARAREAAAAWRAIDGGLTRADVRERAATLRADVAAFRRRWRYLGDDPVRAAVVHAAVESTVATAMRRANGVEDPRRSGHDPMTVGSLAGSVEGGAAALRDARYLYDRFHASLNDRTHLRDRFDSAAESLASRVETGRTARSTRGEYLPDLDRDVEGTALGEAFRELSRGIDYADDMADERASGRLASVVLSARETLAYLDAYDALTERVRDGETTPVETAGDVREIRTAAVDAVKAAQAAIGSSPLDGLSELASAIEADDDELVRHADEETVAVTRLRRPVGRYVQVAARARATPDANAVVAATLRGER